MKKWKDGRGNEARAETMTVKAAEERKEVMHGENRQIWFDAARGGRKECFVSLVMRSC